MSETDHEISMRSSLELWERQERSLKTELERWREVERNRVRTEFFASVSGVMLLLGALIALVSFALGVALGGWML